MSATITPATRRIIARANEAKRAHDDLVEECVRTPDYTGELALRLTRASTLANFNRILALEAIAADVEAGLE